jgi:hypothetical protein
MFFNFRHHASTRQLAPLKMNWTLVARKTTDTEPQTFLLPTNTTAHIVFNKDFGSIAVLSESPHNIDCLELGRISQCTIMCMQLYQALT